MTEERAQRRLAAILAADVVGYSRLMAADEAGTLLALHTWQREILNPVVGSYGGRIVKLMGDGVLAEFASAVNAVECALALQKATQVPNEAVPAERRMTLRIGINLGDVLVKDDDLYGDGVNLAARIEGATEAGTVGLSQAVFDQVRGKVEADFEDTGEHDLKNFARPVRIYRAVAASRLEQTKHLAPAASHCRPSPDQHVGRTRTAIPCRRHYRRHHH
jgi:adenylate cyclase